MNTVYQRNHIANSLTLSCLIWSIFGTESPLFLYLPLYAFQSWLASWLKRTFKSQKAFLKIYFLNYEFSKIYPYHLICSRTSKLSVVLTLLSLIELENCRQSRTVSGFCVTRTGRGSKAKKWKSRTVLRKENMKPVISMQQLLCRAGAMKANSLILLSYFDKS